MLSLTRRVPGLAPFLMEPAEKLHKSCPRPRVAGENRIAGANPDTGPPRPAQGSHDSCRDVVALIFTIRMRAGWTCRSPLAQSAGSPYGYGPSVKTLELATPALAPACARVRLPPPEGLGA